MNYPTTKRLTPSEAFQVFPIPWVHPYKREFAPAEDMKRLVMHKTMRTTHRTKDCISHESLLRRVVDQERKRYEGKEGVKEAGNVPLSMLSPRYNR